MTSQAETVRALVRRFGRSYAAEAGIRLADRPAPLYQLLVLATLLSARISGEIALAAARELFRAGYRTPQAMRAASWQDRVDALGRGRYRRYDGRTATMLGDEAAMLIDRWQGDLRRLRQAAGGDTGRLAAFLTEFAGIGPAGADIFLREVQQVWPEVSPHLDRRVLDGARKAGLPDRPEALARLVRDEGEMVSLAAALVRVSLRKQAAAPVTDATQVTSPGR